MGFARAQLRRAGSLRKRAIHPAQLQLCLDGERCHCYGYGYGYSFILSDRPDDARKLEPFHRYRAQI